MDLFRFREKRSPQPERGPLRRASTASFGFLFVFFLLKKEKRSNHHQQVNFLEE